MEKPFKIRFDFPISNSNAIIALAATAELHHSVPYYIVHSFGFRLSENPTGVSLLPPQEVMAIRKGRSRVWVHKESRRESLLSLAIGKAIEESGSFREENVSG